MEYSLYLNCEFALNDFFYKFKAKLNDYEHK